MSVERGLRHAEAIGNLLERHGVETELDRRCNDGLHGHSRGPAHARDRRAVCARPHLLSARRLHLAGSPAAKSFKNTASKGFVCWGDGGRSEEHTYEIKS